MFFGLYHCLTIQLSNCPPVAIKAYTGRERRTWMLEGFFFFFTKNDTKAIDHVTGVKGTQVKDRNRARHSLHNYQIVSINKGGNDIIRQIASRHSSLPCQDLSEA